MSKMKMSEDEECYKELMALMDGAEIGDKETVENSSANLQAKFSAPVYQTCSLCGEWVKSSQDWLKHHLSDKHKKVVKFLNWFRSKCIEQREDDISPTPENKAVAEHLRNKVLYTQELFETHSTSNLICGVCGAGVFEAENHLLNIKHNEAYMNLLYEKDLIVVKEKCLKSTGVDWRLYEQSLIRQLQQYQPVTDDAPLEICVLKSEEQFSEWMWKYMIALTNFTQPKETSLSYENTLALLVSEDVLKTKNIQQSVLWKSDCCSKMNVFDFLRFGEKFKIVSGSSAEQIRIETSEDPCLGTEAVTEFIDTYDLTKFWICAVCFFVNEDTSEIPNHVVSTKHLINCLDIHYPDIKLAAKTGREMNDEVKQRVREIQLNRTPGKVRLAELVDCTAESIFNLFGLSRNAGESVVVSSSSSSAEQHTNADDDKSEPTVLLSDRNGAMFWCDVCWMLIQVKNNDPATKAVWSRHLASKSHQEKKEVRKELVFEKKNFVEEKEAANIREAIKKDQPLLGLENIIERKIKNKDGTPIHDCVCLLCAEKFHVSSFTGHVTGKDHVIQYLHTNEQQLMSKILNEKQSDAKQKLIDEYLAKHRSNRGKVRVYNPARAEHLSAEYERLKQQIAEKERILEQKRKEKERQLEEDRKREEERKQALMEEERKRLEAQRLAELKRHQEEAERKQAEEEKAMLQMQKLREQQQTEARKKLDQERLLDMMQREQQRQKEEEKKKQGQQRILELMQKEKARLEEDEAKQAEKEERKKAEERAKLVAAAITMSRTLPEPPKVLQPKTSTSSNVPPKVSEAKWVPLAQAEPQRVVIPPKTAGDTRTVIPPSSEKPETADVLVELLQQSTMMPIPYPETSYIQPLLSNHAEALIGLQHVCEFECLDSAYEPGYFCRLCSVRTLAKDLIKHLTSVEHRMKYFEQSYSVFYQNVTTNYDNPGTRAAVIKQYASQIERQEGRRKVEYRLSMRISNTVLSTKKPSLFCTPDTTTSSYLNQPPPGVQYLGSFPMANVAYPPPVINGMPTVSVPPPMLVSPMMQQPPPAVVDMDVCPPGISPPLPINVTTTKKSDYKPIVFPPPPPVVVERPSKKTNGKEKDSKRETSWDDKCQKFLQKLTHQDKSTKDVKSTSQRPSSQNSHNSTEKTVDSKASSKQPGSRKRSRSPANKDDEKRRKVLEDSKTKTVDNRKGKDEKILLSGPVVENKSRTRDKRKSRSRSTSRSRSRRSKSRSPRSKRERSKSPRTKSSSQRSKSPVRRSTSPKPSKSQQGQTKLAKQPTNVNSPKKGLSTIAKEIVSTPTDSDSANVSSLTAEDIVLLQHLADTNPKALEKLVIENPSILAALMSGQSKEKEPPPPVVLHKPAAQAGFDSLVTALLGGGNQSEVAAPEPTSSSSSNTLALLLNMYAEETTKQQKQAEQQRMLLELLQQVGRGGGAGGDLNQAAKQIYDYSHGQSGEEKGKAFEIEDLIKEASANVQQAQKGGNVKKVFEDPTRKAEQNAEQWRELANEKSYSSRTLERSPREMLAKHSQPNVNISKFDKQQQDKMKDAERRRKELMDSLANDLIAPSSSSSHGGVNTHSSASALELDKLLNLARVQSQAQMGAAASGASSLGKVNPTTLALLSLQNQFGVGLNAAPAQQNPLALLGLVAPPLVPPPPQPNLMQQNLAQLASLLGGANSAAIGNMNFGMGQFGNFKG